MQFQTNSKDFNAPPPVCPKPRLHQNKKQRDDLELTIKAVGGEVKFSRPIADSSFSSFFSMISQKRENFKDGPIHYDGTEGSVAFDVKTIKRVLDIALCNGSKGDSNLGLFLDMVRFLQYVDKFKEDDGFKKSLWEVLMEVLGTFDSDTKLAVSYILTTFHNPNDCFEKDYVKEVTYDYVRVLAWDWSSKTPANKEIVEYFASLNDLTFDKAEYNLCSELLCYTKNHLSKHFTDIGSRGALLELKNSLSCLKIRKGNKIVVNGPFKRIDSKGKEMTTGVELEVTSNYDRINGKYVIIGEQHGCPLFKRTTSPDMYVYKHENGHGHALWVISRNRNGGVGRGSCCTNVKSETSLPPESGYCRYNTKITISKYKNKTA